MDSSETQCPPEYIKTLQGIFKCVELVIVRESFFSVNLRSISYITVLYQRSALRYGCTWPGPYYIMQLVLPYLNRAVDPLFVYLLGSG